MDGLVLVKTTKAVIIAECFHPNAIMDILPIVQKLANHLILLGRSMS